MKSTIRRSTLAIFLLVIVPLFWPVGADFWISAPSDVGEPIAGNPASLLTGYERFKAAAITGGADGSLVLALTHSNALSTAPTRARGTATLDFDTGQLTVDVVGVEVAVDSEVWLVDNRPGTGIAGSSEPSGGADVWLRLGPLAVADGAGRLVASLAGRNLSGFEIDRVLVAPLGGDPKAGAWLSGSPSLFQRLYYAERRTGLAPSVHATRIAPGGDSRPWLSPLALLVPAPAFAQAGSSANLAALVAEGEQLFLEETFGGNGRTCGSCHPPANNFTIDPAFIATLPPDDPLFVAEFDPNLSDLEDPALMRDFGLILANIDGFDDPTQKFVMRSVPHLLGMAMSVQNGATAAPFEATGWSGDGAPGGGTLREFTRGAVKQHFTQTLARVEGQDFRLPTDPELDAIEAFMLSLGRQSEIDVESLQLTDLTAEEGRILFITEDSENKTVAAAKCSLCHMNGGAFVVTGVNRSFDTGVEAMLHPAVQAGHSLPIDGGFGVDPDPANGGLGDGRFNVSSLWEVADTGPFFHHNGAATLEEAIGHYDSPEFMHSPEGVFIQSSDSAAQELSVEVDALAAFLRVINTIENIRSATEFAARGRDAATLGPKRRLLNLAIADLEDAIGVLEEGELHPQVVSGLGDTIAALRAAIVDARAPSASCAQKSFARADALMGEGIAHAVVARDLMIAAPLKTLPLPVPVPEDPSSPPPPPPPPSPDPSPTDPVCNIYGCSAGPPPPPPIPGIPPDPTSGGHSAEGLAMGTVFAKDLSASTISIETAQGIVTLQLTTATLFNGSVASNLSQVVIGHDVEASFFLASNEVEKIETQFPETQF